MITIPDLSSCPRSGRYYGGRAGQKIGVLLDGEPWILKFPRPGRELTGKHVPSYTSSPVAEYVSSHIYQGIGIPAHETFLAYRDGKVVCACKDFTFPNGRLIEFAQLKTELSDDDASFVGSPSDGSLTYLSDVLASLDLVDALRETPGVKERFWRMFVVDALIKNPDRNNGNWGLLQDQRTMAMELAPVYDNGSSLFSKRSESLFASRLVSAGANEEDAFGTNVSCYLLYNEETGKAEHIHPFDYMAASGNEHLRAAMSWVAERIDLVEVEHLIDGVPTEAYGRIIMGDATRAAHKQMLSMRVEALRSLVG